jgi:hypothetical protein
MKPFESVGKKTDSVPRVGEAWFDNSGEWLVRYEAELGFRGGADVSY